MRGEEGWEGAWILPRLPTDVPPSFSALQRRLFCRSRSRRRSLRLCRATNAAATVRFPNTNWGEETTVAHKPNGYVAVTHDF